MDEKTVKELSGMIKGRIVPGEELSRHTSFGIGGPADIWAEPSDIEDLRRILKFCKERGVLFHVIGGGSNLLVSDRGIAGVAIHLTSPYFKELNIDGQVVTVGAGYTVGALIKACCDNGLAGLESLVGIPGTVGGAIYMNAGGSSNPIYRNIGEYVTSVKVIDREGEVKTLAKGELKFGYRKSGLEPYIIIQATLALDKGDKDELNSSRLKYLDIKKQKQVLDMRSAGCVFKNPDNFQFTCGQMIDMLGLKGAKVGGAEISNKHANFIVNRKDAKAKDVLDLIAIVKDKVRDNYNIALELEIKII